MEQAINQSLQKLAIFATNSVLQKQLSSFSQHWSDLDITGNDGGIEAAIEYCQKQTSPDWLLVDISGEKEALAQLDRLANYCESHTRVVVVGDNSHVEFYQDLIQLGVSDYLLKPVKAERYHRALEVLMGIQSANTARGKLTAIYGVKGGCGVTTLAANLSWALANEYQVHTAVADSDLIAGDLDLLLGCQSSSQWADLLGLGAGMSQQLANQDSLLLKRAAVSATTRLEMYKSHVASALQSQSLNSDNITPIQPYKLEPKWVSQVSQSLQQNHAQVIWDMPAKAQDQVKQGLLDQADTQIIVIEPSLGSLRELQNWLQQNAQSVKTGQRRLFVLNYKCPKKLCPISQQQIEQVIGTTVDFVLPYQPEVTAKAHDLGQPLVSGNSQLAQQIRALAAAIAGVQTREVSFLARVFPKLAGGR